MKLYDFSSFVERTACTGADGRYTMSRVNSGPHRMEFETAGSCGDAGNVAGEFYDDATSLQSATLFALPGGQTTTIDANPPPSGRST